MKEYSKARIVKQTLKDFDTGQFKIKYQIQMRVIDIGFFAAGRPPQEKDYWIYKTNGMEFGSYDTQEEAEEAIKFLLKDTPEDEVVYEKDIK